jgi:hypothetical protein
MTQSQAISRDDVLYAFAVEDDVGRETLLRYLATYPEYALDLVDLSRELTRSISEEPLSQADEQRVDSAIARLRSGKLKPPPRTLAPQIFNAAANRLDIPLLAMVAFRERRVDLSTVPTRFLRALAQALETTLDDLRAFLSQPATVSATRQSKSRVQPAAPSKVSFEKILQDAGVTPERRQALLKQDE